MAANASAAAESLEFKHVGQQIPTELLLEEQKPSFEANLFAGMCRIHGNMYDYRYLWMSRSAIFKPQKPA